MINSVQSELVARFEVAFLTSIYVRSELEQ